MQQHNQCWYENGGLSHEYDRVLVAPGEHGQRPQNVPCVVEPLLGIESWMGVQEEARHAVHEYRPAGGRVRLRDKLSEMTSALSSA